MVEQCIIVGGSHAGAQVAISLRQEGWDGNILIISDEPCLPYHRPPLSKGFVSGDKTLNDILLRPADYFQTRNIEFLHNVTVLDIDRPNKQLVCSDGETRRYSKLALTTGAQVRKLDLPGAELAGVHYLRNAQDAQAIRRTAVNAESAVIVGGGYIGLELAASFRKAGMHVTVLEMSQRILARVAASELAEFYTRVHEEEGVKIVTGTSAASFIGSHHVDNNVDTQPSATDSSKVVGVLGTDGKDYAADIVIIGVGVIPNTDIAAKAGLQVNNGIVVNEYAQTSDADIVAAGDCTFHPNALLGRSLRLESVPNATEQAKSAAASLCNKQKLYASLPWFWSDQFDLKLQIAGVNHGYDRVVVRGDAQTTRSIAVFYLKQNNVIAVDCVNRAPEFAVIKKALSKNLKLRVEELANESIKPKELIIESDV